jgi:hypothetical protein
MSALVLTLLSASPAGVAQSEPVADQPLPYLHGRLSYRVKADGRERGIEDWWLTRNRDGSRTMRSLATTFDSKFVRDVTYTLGPDQRPYRVFIQLQVADEIIGSGYFRVERDELRIVTDMIHTVQTLHAPARLHILTHAVMLDGWPAWGFDPNGPAEQTLSVYSTSPLWNGTSGPLGRMQQQRFRLVGTEKITVPAGTFEARHFSFGEDAGSHVWVTGEDNILLKYDWPPHGLEYVLVTLNSENLGE